jgi:hypothetical protein
MLVVNGSIYSDVNVQSGAAKKPQQINKEGCSATRDIHTIGTTMLESDMNLYRYKMTVA